MQKEYKTRYDCLGKDDILGTVQEIDILPYYQMVHVQNRIHLGEWDEQISQEYCNANRSPDPGQETSPRDSKKKKKKKKKRKPAE